jgi:hypothetical protein
MTPPILSRHEDMTDFFDAAQWQSVLDGKPVLVTGEQLAILFGFDDEDEIYELARRGLLVRAGEFFDARASTQNYCA